MEAGRKAQSAKDREENTDEEKEDKTRSKSAAAEFSCIATAVIKGEKKPLQNRPTISEKATADPKHTGADKSQTAGAPETTVPPPPCITESIKNISFQEKPTTRGTIAMNCFLCVSSDSHTHTNFIIIFFNFCLSNAVHCMGQNIKSLAACFCVCVCVCARVLGAEYLENG